MSVAPLNICRLPTHPSTQRSAGAPAPTSVPSHLLMVSTWRSSEPPTGSPVMLQGRSSLGSSLYPGALPPAGAHAAPRLPLCWRRLILTHKLAPLPRHVRPSALRNDRLGSGGWGRKQMKGSAAGVAHVVPRQVRAL